MALSDFNIKVTIGAETSQFENGLKKVQAQTSQVSSNFSKFTNGIKKSLLKGGAVGLAIAATTTAIKKLSDTIKKSIKLWDEANAAQNKLAQTLKVTGASAWTTTEELNAMADAYQKATNFSANDVNKMQTVLLGFKNITEDTFKSASDAILDMAEVMGMDLVSATQTVGKALDDPVHGMDSLSRQGFKFSDAEKELIKNLVEAGDAAKAQKIILDELNTTYGGAAEKGVKAATQIKNNWNSLLQEMGRNISMSIDIEPAKKKLNELLEYWKNIQKEMADAKEYSDNIIKAQKAAAEGAATYEQNLLLVEDEIKKIQDLRYTYEVAYQTAVNNGWEEEAKYQQEHIDALNRELKPLENRKKIIEEVIALEKQQAEESEKANAAAAEQEQLEASIAALKLKYLKLIAEQEKQWELQKTVTGQAVDLEEKRNFYQTKLVEIMKESGGQITANNQYYKDQQKIIADITAEIEKQNSTLADIAGWNDKLLEQEIARLEARRDSEISAGILDEIDIRNYYNEQIVKLKEQQIERELAVALKGVEGTENEEEAKLKIIEYYNKKKLQNAMEYAKQKKKVDDKSNKTEVKVWKDKFKEMASVTKNAVSKISGYMSKITKTFISSVKGIFIKAFKFDPDEALDSLLAFEDSVLTFFVETLPQMPSFVDSALESIEVLLNNLDSLIDEDKIAEIVEGMVKSLSDRLPRIVKTLMSVGKKLLLGLIKGITNNLPEIKKTLYIIKDEAMNTLREIIPALTSLVGTLLREGIPFLISTAFDIIDIICENFPAFAQELINTLPIIVESVVENLPKFFEESLPKLIQGIADIIPDLFKSTGDIIVTLVDNLPKIVFAIIEGITKLLKELNAEDIAKLVSSVIKMVADVAESLLTNIGKIVAELIPLMVTLVVELIKSIPDIIKGLVTGTWEGIKEVGSAVWEGIKDIGSGLKDLGGKVVDGLKSLLGFATGTNNAPKGLALVGEAGPELIDFKGGERVYNNTNTEKILANAGSGANVFNVTFNNTQDTTAFAMVRQLRSYQRNLAFNGVL